LRTLHLDRVRLHEELQRKAAACGIRRVREKAAAIEGSRKKLAAVISSSGNRYAARWFIDASGSAASFLGRQFSLPSVEHGPRKVGMWSYIPSKEWSEGTTLYAENHNGEYLRWIWEIPITPEETSIGYVTTGATLKQQRAGGRSVQDVFEHQVGRFERFRTILEHGKLPTPEVTAFSCRAYKGVCGSNWIIIGEAASVPDPITGNGVTSALRHAAEGATLILKFNRRRRISWWARAIYSFRVVQMNRFFNSLIEKLAYECPLRDRFGLLRTGDVYTRDCLVNESLVLAHTTKGGVTDALILWQLGAFSLRSPGWLNRLSAGYHPELGSSCARLLKPHASLAPWLGRSDLIPPRCAHEQSALDEHYRKAFRTVRLLHPGSSRVGSEGRKPCRLGHFHEIAEEIDALRKAAGVESWNVVGHDAGSAIAVFYAHSFPQCVNRLSLMAPALLPELRPFYLFVILRTPVVGELLAPCVNAIFWRLAMLRACEGEDGNATAVVSAFRVPFTGPLGAWHMMRVLRWRKLQKFLPKCLRSYRSYARQHSFFKERTMPLFQRFSRAGQRSLFRTPD
jgi:pimeloyl-ACP methyl ester carboxylesterase